MASTYNTLVVQQLEHARPSPTLQVSDALDSSSAYSPGHTPCPSAGVSTHEAAAVDYFDSTRTRSNSQVYETAAPPCTPITSPSTRRVTSTTNNNIIATTTTIANKTATNATPKHQRVASQNGLPAIQVTKTPTSAVLTKPLASSPKGVSDVFSLSSDKQLSAQYWFIEEIGYGNWVCCAFHLRSTLPITDHRSARSLHRDQYGRFSSEKNLNRN